MIHATVHVERDSQKPIVLGAGGARLRAVGTTARRRDRGAARRPRLPRPARERPQGLAARPEATAPPGILRSSCSVRTGRFCGFQGRSRSSWPAWLPGSRSRCRRSASSCSSAPPPARTRWPAPSRPPSRWRRRCSRRCSAGWSTGTARPGCCCRPWSCTRPASAGWSRSPSPAPRPGRCSRPRPSSAAPIRSPVRWCGPAGRTRCPARRCCRPRSRWSRCWTRSCSSSARCW